MKKLKDWFTRPEEGSTRIRVRQYHDGRTAYRAEAYEREYGGWYPVDEEREDFITADADKELFIQRYYRDKVVSERYM